MKVLIAILVSTAMLSSATTGAADYVVQVGAYKDPSTFDRGRLRTFGDVQLEPGADGITRVKVGRFRTREDADASLQALRRAGYSDAYVVTSGHAATTPRGAPPSIHGGNDDLAARYLAAKTKLPATSAGTIVVVDGRLMLKLGEQFSPLE